MKQLNLKIVGTSPLLMSSDRLADPLDPITIAHKELTSKRNKTHEDHLAIARSQWQGLLYWDENIGAVLPTANLVASLIGGGKLNKLGMHLKRGVIALDEVLPLDYGKKLTIDQLWEQRYLDRRSVVVSKARVIAYRPKFTTWSVNFNLLFDELTLDESQIMQSATNAGNYVGVGGYRPEKGGTFGRFTVEKA